MVNFQVGDLVEYVGQRMQQYKGVWRVVGQQTIVGTICYRCVRPSDPDSDGIPFSVDNLRAVKEDKFKKDDIVDYVGPNPQYAGRWRIVGKFKNNTSCYVCIRLPSSFHSEGIPLLESSLRGPWATHIPDFAAQTDAIIADIMKQMNQEVNHAHVQC